MTIIKLLAAVAVMGLVTWGCSNSDSGTNPGQHESTSTTTWDGVGQFWVTTLDATSYDKYTYYSFAKRDVVDMTDDQADNSSDWDIAFKRYHVTTNGGVFGAGHVMAANLVLAGETDTLGFASVTAADTAGLSSSDWMENSYNRVIDNYFRLQQDFSVQMTDYVYAMRDASGNYLKLQFENILGGGAPPTMGDIILKYVYQPLAAATDLSGPVEIDTIHTTSDTVFYDFSSSSYTLGTRPSDPLGWDLRLFHYEVSLNSTISGPGGAVANPVYLIPGHSTASDSTDFDGYSQAETAPEAYSTDFVSSALEMGDVGSEKNWYMYWEQNHTITSLKYTYIVHSGGKYYKLYFVSYYDPDNPANAGIITFNWSEL